MRLFVVALCLIVTPSVWADQLMDYLNGVGNLQIVRHERRTVSPRPEATPAALPRPLMRGVIGFNIGGLIPLAAREENPSGALGAGLLLRFPLRPGLPMGRFEVALNGTVTKLMRDTPPGIDEFYEEYWELTICYLGHFGGARRMLQPFWGIGLGYASESIVVESGSLTARDKETTGLFILKLGWDTLHGISMEFSIRWLLNTDCNISSMAALILTVYF